MTIFCLYDDLSDTGKFYKTREAFANAVRRKITPKRGIPMLSALYYYPDRDEYMVAIL